MSVIKNLLLFKDSKISKTNKGFIPGCSDEFLGLRMGKVREIAKSNTDIDFKDLELLLSSKYHEAKLCGLVILGNKTDRAIKKDDEELLLDIRDFYISNLKYVNSWDLVDVSAYKVLGNILIHNVKKVVKISDLKSFNDSKTGFITLDVLANSENLWARRISIISQFSFLWADNIQVPLSLCQFHIKDHHHYIQKAVGWILREVGKRDKNALDRFLIDNIDVIGSICLSYALEKHSKEEKKQIRDLKNEGNLK